MTESTTARDRAMAIAAPEGVDAVDEPDDDGMDLEAQGAMADQLDDAQAAIQRVRAVHARQETAGKATCAQCVDWDEEPTAWPCSTVRALDGDTADEQQLADDDHAGALRDDVMRVIAEHNLQGWACDDDPVPDMVRTVLTHQADQINRLRGRLAVLEVQALGDPGVAAALDEAARVCREAP